MHSYNLLFITVSPIKFKIGAAQDMSFSSKQGCKVTVHSYYNCQPIFFDNIHQLQLFPFYIFKFADSPVHFSPDSSVSMTGK